MVDVLILCGGRGTRLGRSTDQRPKPMLEVKGRPFLEWILLHLRSQGIRKATLCTGYLGESIERHFGDGTPLGMQLQYSREAEPLGTGGALRRALDQTASEFIAVLNGDSFSGAELHALEKACRSRNARASVWLVQSNDLSRFGSVELANDGSVSDFHEKPSGRSSGLINAGAYVFHRSVLETIPVGRAASLETAVLPGLANNGLYGVIGEGPFVDIGTPEMLAAAAALLGQTLQRLAAGESDDLRLIRDRLAESAELQLRTATDCASKIIQAADTITTAFRSGRKVLLCGNGGSAADCQHVAAEFMGILNKQIVRRGLPAIALTTDTSFLTAYANDSGFEGVFERQVRALGSPNDVLLAISTSGNAKNVELAVRAASEIGMRTIGLCGLSGRLISQVECAIVVPSHKTQLIQESLLPVEHAICELVEAALFSPVRVSS
jgi:phosphoheptose isomerase/UTP-glucose-1-phosphate uridylyltransferase